MSSRLLRMRSRDRDIRIFSMALRVNRGGSSVTSGARGSMRSTTKRRAIPRRRRRDCKGFFMKRERIFGRDHYRCVYCGERFLAEELTLDHVQARVRGGDRSEGNLVT